MKILDTIKALLAKAESSTFEAEKETYYAKAQELMVKHAIAESELAPEVREGIIERTIFITASRADAMLYFYTAKAHGVDFVRIHHYRGSTSERKALMIGYPTDIDFVLSLVASLYIHREQELVKAPKPEWEHGKRFNHSFRLAFAVRIYQRLSALFAEAVAHENGALVLFNRGKQVERYVKANLRVQSSGRISSTSLAGNAAGRTAANSASLLGARNNLANNAQRALA